MTTLRLVAVDGVRVDRPDKYPPDVHTLSGRAKELLYHFGSIGMLDTDGTFSVPMTLLCKNKGWNVDRTRKALNELREGGFVLLVQENYGRKPRVWRLHPFFDWDAKRREELDRKYPHRRKYTALH